MADPPPNLGRPTLRMARDIIGTCSLAKTGRNHRKKFHFGEQFPRVGFIVTNLETPTWAVVRFYNKRGTAEQWD